MIHFLKITLLMFLLLLSTSCSKLNIAYDYGSYKLKNSISESYSFKNSDSDKKVRDIWAKNTAENKIVIYKNLNLLITDIEKATLNNELTAGSVESLYADFKNKRKNIVNLFTTAIDVTMNEISESEIKNFKNYNLKKINEHTYAESDLKSRFLDRAESIMEYFFDDFTKEQIQISNQFFEDNKIFLMGQKDRRLKFGDTFVSLFPEREKMKSYMISYYSADDSIRSPEYKKEIQLLEVNSKKFVLDISKSLTAQQKKEFQKTVVRIKRQLNEI